MRNNFTNTAQYLLFLHCTESTTDEMTRSLIRKWAHLCEEGLHLPWKDARRASESITNLQRIPETFDKMYVCSAIAFHSRMLTKSRALQSCVKRQFKQLMAVGKENAQVFGFCKCLFYLIETPVSRHMPLWLRCPHQSKWASVRSRISGWAAHRPQSQPPQVRLFFTVHTGSKMTEMCLRRHMTYI